MIDERSEAGRSPSEPTVTGARERLRPAEFARRLKATLAASEGRRKRRKRDTTPDAIGFGIKHDLLDATIADDPGPEDYEAWLLERALSAPASGPVRALCSEIRSEERRV